MRILIFFLIIISSTKACEAFEWHSENWWGYEDWYIEACQIKTTTMSGIPFVIQKNWEGKYWVGIEPHGISKDYIDRDLVGAITVDDSATELMDGFIQNRFILFEDKNRKSRLEDSIIRGNYLRIAALGNSVIVSLKGSSKANFWLDECAQRVWPGAGD